MRCVPGVPTEDLPPRDDAGDAAGWKPFFALLFGDEFAPASTRRRCSGVPTAKRHKEVMSVFLSAVPSLSHRYSETENT